jgi:hypothetical protein
MVSDRATYLVPLAAVLGDRVPIADLPGLSAAQVERYQSYGYVNCRVSDRDAFTLSASSMLDSPEFDRVSGEVDLFVYAVEPQVNSSNNWMLNEKRWQTKDIRWLLQRLEIRPARVLGLSLYNCAAFVSAIDVSMNLIRAGAATTSLVTLAGVANDHSPRIPHAFHVQSDGAAGFLVTGRADFNEKYRILGQLVRYANPSDFRDLSGVVDETRYYTLKAFRIRSTIEALLQKAGVRPDELDWIFVQNLGTSSMVKYGHLAGVGPGRVWLESLARNAHVIGADSLINFYDYHNRVVVRPAAGQRGSRVLVVGTSGMSWGGVVLEHVGRH